MIYSFSHRTDGPAFHWSWFLHRLEEGVAMVRNPYYPDKVSVYDLRGPTCEGFLFTSKDYRPVMDGRARMRSLADLTESYATMWNFTITPYRSDIERICPSNAEAIECAATLSRVVGRQRLTWLYSPIAIWDGVYDWRYHVDAFTHLAKRLGPYVSRCSVDELRVYEKVSRNAPMLREPHRFELEAMLPQFKRAADENGIELHSCPAHHNWSDFGINCGPCNDLARFADANGLELRNSKVAAGTGLYGTCPAGCAPVRDLASYGTCPAGCLYCYANPVPQGTVSGFDASSLMLCDKSMPHDKISAAKQRRYFK